MALIKSCLMSTKAINYEVFTPFTTSSYAGQIGGTIAGITGEHDGLIASFSAASAGDVTGVSSVTITLNGTNVANDKVHYTFGSNKNIVVYGDFKYSNTDTVAITIVTTGGFSNGALNVIGI